MRLVDLAGTAGDSFVIPGSVHGWRNPFADHALMACSVTALIDS